MKRLLYIGALLCMSAAQGCNEKAIKNTDESSLNEDSVEMMVDTNYKSSNRELNHQLLVAHTDDLIGDWVGMFEADSIIESVLAGEHLVYNNANKINISIDNIEGDAVSGHSVVAGNHRPFFGHIEIEEKKFLINVKEPGDDPYDGRFEFTITKGDSIASGVWNAYEEVKIPRRKYELVKKIFSYNPKWKLNEQPFVDWEKIKKVELVADSEIDPEMAGKKYLDNSYFTTTEDVYKYNASLDRLTKEQVANMKKADIFILRNSILARHGYSFKNKQLRAYFDMQPWYIPISINVLAQLTSLEKKNIELLMRYEQNAKEYYDVFGRG